MSVSPFDSPLLSGLLGDEKVATLFSTEAELAAMAAFEVALVRAEAEEGVVPEDAAREIATRIESFVPDIAAIGAATTRNGVVGVEFVRQLRAHIGSDFGSYVHFGATSQDLIDTAFVLRLKPALAALGARLETVIAALDRLDAEHGSRRLMGHTRMQPALPITVSDRVSAWRAPLLRHRERLKRLQPTLLVAQFGGAVGTRDKLGAKGDVVAKRLADKLGLGLAEAVWHTGRDNLAELSGWCAMLSGAIGKFGTDITLLAQAGTEIRLEGGGGSSAMPHKSNPVAAETSIALARFAATLSAGMNQALVHEQERSGAAWTLEWLCLPQLILAAAASLRTAEIMLKQIRELGDGAGS